MTRRGRSQLDSPAPAQRAFERRFEVEVTRLELWGICIRDVGCDQLLAMGPEIGRVLVKAKCVV